MKIYITDGKVLDGAGISSFDTLEEAKEVWCFWMNVYELDSDMWQSIKIQCSGYAEASLYLEKNFTSIYSK